MGRQLDGHVELPESFRFTWRGRPFNRTQEQHRTIAECLPSLQLRPVLVTTAKQSGIGAHYQFQQSRLIGMPLDDIMEDNYDVGMQSGYTDLSSDSGFVSGSVIYAERGGRGRRRRHGRRRRRVGGSDTEASERGKHRRSKRSSKRSKVAKLAAKKKKARMKARARKNPGQNTESDSGLNATATETETEIDGGGASESSASEDSFDELTQ